MMEISIETSQAVVYTHGEKATMTFSWTFHGFDGAQHWEAHGAAESDQTRSLTDILQLTKKKEKRKKS